MPSALQTTVQRIIASNDYLWAWQSYKDVVLSIRDYFDCRSLMEIGAGRSPLLTEQECRALGIAYTINDISPKELALAPDWPLKACFDISSRGPVSGDRGYDLIFSKMVFEHLQDAEGAYERIRALLVDGGICVCFYPTLYCLPFLANFVLPKTLSQKLAGIFDPRSDPKFPAYYKWCRSTDHIRKRLERLGYTEVIIVPFYGHNYYRTVPSLRRLEERWRCFAQRHDIRFSSSFAYAILQR